MFVTPTLFSFQTKKRLLFGQGAYGHPFNMKRLKEVSSRLGMVHRGFHNIGSTWLGETKLLIEAGKKTEMVFEYKTEVLDLVETFWRFVVDNQNVSVPFLLVAYGSEPNVSLDRSHINFKEILIGTLDCHLFLKQISKLKWYKKTSNNFIFNSPLCWYFCDSLSVKYIFSFISFVTSFRHRLCSAGDVEHFQ